jgi:adenylate kinase family enzyme
LKKVAIFGNAGAGKSILALKLHQQTGLPLYHIDQMQYLEGGTPVAHEEYLKVHSALIDEEEWIIDGFGCVHSAWARFDQADTLIFLDPPMWRLVLWISKRFLMGLFKTPAGWPNQSPLIKSTLNSFKVVRLCHLKLTPKYREYVKKMKHIKQVHHFISRKDMKVFLKSLEERAP